MFRNSELIHALFLDQLAGIKPPTYYMEPLFLPHFESNEAALMAPDDPSVITIYTLNFQLAQTLSPPFIPHTRVTFYPTNPTSLQLRSKPRLVTLF